MKIKCWTGNLDGRRYGMVYAKSQKDAAKAVGTSRNRFRMYFGIRENWPMMNPIIGVLYTKPFDDPDSSYVLGMCSLTPYRR